MNAPPYKITSKAINLISEISILLGSIQSAEDSKESILLREKNRIQTIHSSLAIEHNTLSLEQVTAIIEGKRILGDPREIREVQNAMSTYDLLEQLNPYEEKDLLRAHGFMMQNLVSLNGQYRNDGVGIFAGEKLVHLAPPPERVPQLMSDLFEWLKTSDEHPLIKSCVFHYEFEFIHPFQDGNGRMGRLWHTVILKEWNKIFAWLPIENVIKENQSDYYKYLNLSDDNADSTLFIEFMLNVIFDALNKSKRFHRIAPKISKKITAKITPKITVNQQKIIDAIKENPFITQEELANIVGIAKLNIVKNMKKLQENNIILRIGADKNGHWEVVE